jgi:hypothetical protein
MYHVSFWWSGACPTFGLAWPKGCAYQWLSILARYRILGLSAGGPQDLADHGTLMSEQVRIDACVCLRYLSQGLLVLTRTQSSSCAK